MAAITPGKPPARVAAVEVALDHLFGNGPEEPIFFLKTALLLDDRPDAERYFQKVETKRSTSGIPP
jgi:hypothetical protein